MRNSLIYLSFLATTAFFVLNSCQSEEELNYTRYFVNGKVLYEEHCQNCHAGDGKGLGQLVPPLTDTLFLKANRTKLACYIKYGLRDTIAVGGKIYNEKMPADSHLADIEIAQIVTYITNSFGNKQNLYDVNDAGKDIEACQRDR